MAVDAEHVLVCGPSGGGKTTYLREMHDWHDGPSIFLTPDLERKAPSTPPRRIRKSRADYPADIETARQWARAHDETVQVIIDEVQNAPTFADDEYGPVAKMLHEDRSGGLKAVLATQNPMSLRTKDEGYGRIQQCEYWVFVGKAKDWHAGFFDGNGLASLKPHVPDRNYEYIVIDPAMSKQGTEKIVYRGETKRKYA